MRTAFTSHGWDDRASWLEDRKTLERLNRLIREAARDPGEGTGKPERLSGGPLRLLVTTRRSGAPPRVHRRRRAVGHRPGALPLLTSLPPCRGPG
nr:type II toxin-antitoxin system YoeB family toxin [Blastococcus haudaquaticus]